jgi:glycosyltransferase involved in cell wall biosynthesis
MAPLSPTLLKEPPAPTRRQTPPVVCVLVPTYRRTGPLRECLSALIAQERRPDEVVLTVRDSDEETWAFLAGSPELARSLPLTVVKIESRGVVAAMNGGLTALRADADIVALTDDDSEPHPDWLRRIEDLFESNPDAVGVGGRDMLPYDAEEPEREEVGVLRWYGKAIGFHHKGVGPVRPVDLLKGVNCAFRAVPLRRVGFDTCLKGGGAQVHWEMSLCLRLKAEAGTSDALLYDPALRVDHNPAPRHDNDVNHRGGFDAPALGDAIYNETLVLLEALPPVRRAAFWMWTHLIGTGMSPGLAQFVRFALKRDPTAALRVSVAFAARAAALRDHRRSLRAGVETPPPPRRPAGAGA